MRLLAGPAASQYFLSRPRRFGKSLMIATLREIFKGRGYADAYRDDLRPVWLIGCNYNPDT